MLAIAKLYEEELNKENCKFILDKRAEYYYLQYPETKIHLEDSFYNYIQMVSINTDNSVGGYFSASISRPENFVSHISAVNFKNPNMIFAKDLKAFIDYLINTVNTPKIEWRVIIGNPIEPYYDKLCQKFGGRVIGTSKYSVLINNRYRDAKLYEWINDYYECTQCGHKEKNEEEVFCKKCSLGEMVYHNPFK